VTDAAWIASALAKVCAGAAPGGPPPSHAEMADAMLLPDGPEAGKPWNWRGEPAQAVIIDALDSPDYRAIVAAGPRQVGKTLGTVHLPLLRATIGAGLPSVYALPTLDDVDKAWAAKLRPALIGCGFEKYMPRSGAGSKGGRGFGIPFHDYDAARALGTLLFMAGDGYGATAATVVIDEADWFSRGNEPNLSAIHNVFACANSFDATGRSRRIVTSTVEWDKGSTILAALVESTDGRLWFQCPECQRYQPLAWDRVKYEGNDDEAVRQSVRYHCANCPEQWTEATRRAALRRYRYVARGQAVDERGRVTGERPRADAFGLLWTGLDSSLLDMPSLAAEHARARRGLQLSPPDHEPMRKFTRMRLTAGYTSDAADDESGKPRQLTRAALAVRSASSTYGPAADARDADGDSIHVAPMAEGVEFMCATVDVQRGDEDAPPRLYWLLMGGDSCTTSWDQAWGSVTLSPPGSQANVRDLHAGLDRLNATLVRLCQQYDRPLLRRGVDVGDRQDEIRMWLARHPEWWAIKGSSGSMERKDPYDLPGWIYRRPQEKDGHAWPLWFVDTDGARREAQQRFYVVAGNAGAAHLPRGLSEQTTLVRHYCSTAEIPGARGATRWSSGAKDRQHHPEWQRRNDYLACRTYGMALLYQLSRELAGTSKQEDAPARPAQVIKPRRELPPWRRRSSIMDRRRR
jgi:phage terminase large subunit GpA-like protein